MKKRMSAFRKVISLFVLSCLFCGVLFAGVSCKTQELSIVLVDEFDRELLYVSEEYDALSLVVPQEKVTYSIAELFWFDVNLEKHDIPFSGTKFVQDLPYAVLMTLRAVKGKATAAADVELTVSFRTGDIVDAMLVSWVDDGVSLSLSAAHLFGGSKAGIRVSYNGSKNDVGNGRTFGGFGAQKARKAYSVTDWSDAVVTFYAYNPNVFDLTVALMWNDGVNGWRGAGQSGDVPSCVLKAGEWTTVAWSFLNLGVDFDFLNAGGNFVFKVWMDEAAAAGAANYQYSFYVCGMDIANYDATRFPDTDNTPPVTEFYTAPAAAALLASHKDDGITRAASEDPAYIRDYKKFGSNERSVAVTYNGNDNIPDDGFNFGGFASAYEHFSVGDWSGGSVVFGAYNPNLFDLNIGMAYDDGAGWKGTGYDQTVGATALPALEWTTVTYSFADLNVTGNFVENGGDFLFKVWLSAGVASTLSKPYAYTFYIREMDVVNNGPVPSTPALDAWANSWSDDGVSKTVTNNPKYLYGDEEAALKFGYRGELNSPGNGLNIGGFENASEYFSVTDWGDAAIRFYAYNSNVFDLTAALMWNDGSGWYGAGQTSLVPIRVLKAGEWTEVTWPLKSLGIETNFLENGGHFCVKMWIPENLAGAMAKPYSYEFYICGADIIDYTGSDPDPEIDSAAEIADVMLNSYADEDVSKTLTADSQYLYDGCEVGVKVRYTGNDGLRNFGSFRDAREYFSVTDWSDAAIRFYAYNPGVTDLTVYFMWTDDGNTWHGADHDGSPAGIFLKGGEWTTVTWSLNDLGITTDFLANTEAKFWLKIGDAGPWEFYMCGMDIIDYTGGDPEIDSAAEIADVMLNSYADEDVSKTLTADSQYLYEGNEVGVKVGYTGNGDLRNFGSFMDARGYFSVTDWNDAAIRFYAYNPSVTDLTVYFMWTDDGNTWHGADHDSSPAGIFLKGGEWTTVTWSLNDLGITTDFLANTEAKFWLKIGDAGPWEFYMCGMDIIDYDSAANGIADALLKSWSDDGVSKTLTVDPQYLYDGCGVGVSVGYTGDDGLRNFGSFRDARGYFSVTDWSDAAIRFYAYNPGETDLTVHLGWTADGDDWYGADYGGLPAGISLKAGEWTTVTWSLNELEITTDFLANARANFVLKIGNAGPWEFYVCGMDIINAE